MARLSAGILTVSDTLAAQPAAQRADGAGDAAEAHLAALGLSTRRAVVPDDAARIAAQVRAWRDAEEAPCDLIVSSGGTGFGVRDGTPEALAPLIDKPAPGLAHLLVAASLKHTPLAALSRPVCGVSLRPGGAGRGSLVVALPGSSKAVRECLEALSGAGVLAHALDLVTGGDGRAVHARLQGPDGGRDGARGVSGTETDTGRAHVGGGHHHGEGHAHHHGEGHAHRHGEGHAHHHGSHSHSHAHSAPKPRTAQRFVTVEPGAPAGRHRQSPYELQPLATALALIAQHTPGAGPSRRVSLARLAGCVLAEDVRAPLDLPPRATSNIDGYAVEAGATPAGEYRVVRGGIQPGAVCRINTGQALPPGTDAVVMVEDTELLRASADGEEEAVRVLAQVDARENVRAAGSDVRTGDVVLRAGQRVGTLGGEIGTLAFLGCAEALVYPKPVVAILSTGNELQDIGAASAQAAGEDGWDFRVWDSNRPGLRAAIEGQGFEVLDLGIVGDDREKTVAALQRGIAHADVVLTTGGTSMGESDLLKPIIERDLGGTIHFGRVAMKPGKPTTFATVPADRPTVLFALPGNPASALVCFYVFVLPALRKLGGLGAAAGRVKVRLAEAMRLDPRPEFHRVVVAPDANGELVARSTGAQRSSGMHSMATANALVCVPALDAGGPRTLEAGARAEAILLGPL